MEEEKLDPVIDPEAGSQTLHAVGSPGLHEFIRYFAASAVALLADAGSLYVLVALGMEYLVAGAVAFSIGLVVVYVLSVFWVFETRSTRSASAEFILFVLIGLVGLGVNELVLYVASGIFGLPLFVAKAGSIGVVFTWNFSARKFLLFRS